MQQINSIGISCDMGNSLAMDDCFIWILSVSQYPNLLLTNPVGRCDKRPSISLGQHDQINNLSILPLWSLTSPPLNGRSCIYIYTRIIMYIYMLLCDTWTMIASCESIGSPWRHQQGDAFLCWSQEGGEIPTAHASGSQRRPGMRCRKWALHSLVIHGFSIMLGPEWGKS